MNQLMLEANQVHINASALEHEVNTLSSQVKEVMEKERELNSTLNSLTSEPTDENLDKILAETENKVSEKKSRLEKILALTKGSNSDKKIDSNSYQNAINEYNFYRNSWKERKEKCVNVVEMLLDASEGKMKAKDLMVILLILILKLLLLS